MALVSESEYKGNPMIVLKRTEDDKFPFQFGVKKAKLVLEHIEAIRKFVNNHGDAASAPAVSPAEAAESNM